MTILPWLLTLLCGVSSDVTEEDWNVVKVKEIQVMSGEWVEPYTGEKGHDGDMNTFMKAKKEDGYMKIMNTVTKANKENISLKVLFNMKHLSDQWISRVTVTTTPDSGLDYEIKLFSREGEQKLSCEEENRINLQSESTESTESTETTVYRCAETTSVNYLTVSSDEEFLKINEIKITAAGCSIPFKLTDKVVGYYNSQVEQEGNQPYMSYSSLLLATCDYGLKAFRYRDVNLSFPAKNCGRVGMDFTFDSVFVLQTKAEPESYDTMKGVCKDNGGNPAKITNLLENDKAVWLMKARSIETAFFGLRYKSDKHFEYEDGSEDSFKNWYDEEPNSGADEPCAAVHIKSNKVGKWADVGCEVAIFNPVFGSIGFLCQYNNLQNTGSCLE